MNGNSQQHVLVLFEYATLNGGEHSFLAVLDELQRSRSVFSLELVMTAIVPNGPLRQRLQQRKITTIECDLSAVKPEKRNEHLAMVLQATIQKTEATLVHANSLAMGRRLGAISSEISCATTCHFRDIIKLSNKAISDLNCLSSIVAVSDATRLFHIQQGIESSKIETIFNGIDCEKFAPRTRTGSLCHELNLPETTPLALTIGQICMRKGHNDIAQAMVILKDRCPKLHWIIAGERHSTKAESIAFDEQIDRTLESADMLDRRHRLGFRADIPLLLNEVDLLVHAARQEPLGRSLLEAAASAVPIIATDVGGTNEILTNTLTARLIPPGDPMAIAKAIEVTVKHRKEAKTMAQLARTFIQQRFTPRESAMKLVEFWKTAMQGPEK